MASLEARTRVEAIVTDMRGDCGIDGDGLGGREDRKQGQIGMEVGKVEGRRRREKKLKSRFGREKLSLR